MSSSSCSSAAGKPSSDTTHTHNLCTSGAATQLVAAALAQEAARDRIGNHNNSTITQPCEGPSLYYCSVCGVLCLVVSSAGVIRRAVATEAALFCRDYIVVMTPPSLSVSTATAVAAAARAASAMSAILSQAVAATRDVFTVVEVAADGRILPPLHQALWKHLQRLFGKELRAELGATNVASVEEAALAAIATTWLEVRAARRSWKDAERKRAKRNRAAGYSSDPSVAGAGAGASAGAGAGAGAGATKRKQQKQTHHST